MTWIDPAEDLSGTDGPGGLQDPTICRRTLLKSLAALGVGTVTFRRALAAQAAQSGAITPEMIKQAEWIAGLDLTEEERKSTVRSITRSLRSFAELRKVDVGYDVPPALAFLPVPPRPASDVRRNQAQSRPGADIAPAGLRRGAGFPASERAFELGPEPPGQLDGADEALS